MAKNIIIIAVVAILAFAAVLAVPRMLNGDSSDQNEDVAANDDDRDDGADSGSGDDSSSADSTDVAASAPPIAPNPQLEAQLQEAARQINAGGPIRIDQMTTMNGATAQGNRIRYRYEVSQTFGNDQIAQFREYAQRTNQQTLCSRPETRRLLDMGGEIEYAYYGPGDTYLFSTPITGC